MREGIDVADYDAVVSAIYEAALAPSGWDLALTSLVSRFGGDHWDVALLVWERVAPPAGRFLGSTGLNEQARHGYVLAFAGNNAWSIGGHDLPTGTVAMSDTLVARETFRETSFSRDFLSHYGIEIGILAMLDRHGASHLGLCLPGPDNGSSHRLEAAVRLLVPHFQRAARISRRIGEAELSASTARAALDCAPSPVLLCDAEMRLTFANAHAERLIEQGWLHPRGGRIALGRRALDERLAALARGTASERSVSFALTHPDAEPLAAMAIRLDPAERGLDTALGGAGLMIVAGRDHRVSDEQMNQLRDWYGLTPAEARLGARLATGETLEQFAASRGISLNAARFLLRGIYAKTGANRLPALVSLLRATPIAWGAAQPTPDLPDPLA